jgi:hypothetical protein
VEQDEQTLRQHLEQLRQQTARLEAALTREQARGLRKLRPPQKLKVKKPEQLRRTVQQFEEYNAALEEVVGDATGEANCAEPDPRMAALVRELDPEAQLQGLPLGQKGLQARLTVDGIAITLVAGKDRVELMTSVPGTTPELSLAPQTGSMHPLRALKRITKISLGDPTFDAMFHCQTGSREYARKLLPAPARAGLLEVARDDVPRLLIGRGRVHLSWRFEASRSALHGAVKALVAIASDG